MIVESLQDPNRCFVFINYLHHSHVYALQLPPEPQDTCPVLWIHGTAQAVIAESLTDFFAVYLSDPDGILFPPSL